MSIAGGAVATVKNGTVIGGTSWYTIEVRKNSAASLTLEDVTATAGNTGSSMIDNWGTLTINSGTYTGGLDVVKSEEGSTLTITGGKFTLNYAKKWDFTAVILVYGDTTITGGTFIQNAKITSAYPQVVMTGVVDGYTAITKITGGTFENNFSGTRSGIFWALGKATSENFEVSGGTFNKSISKDYCAVGFIPTKNANGTYGVTLSEVVFVNGEAKTLGETAKTALADVKTATAGGATVQYMVVDATGTKVTAEDVDDRTLDFAKLPNGTYTLRAKMTQDGTTETKEMEIVKVGVVQVAKNALTILAVPFADIDGKPVTVATLFNAAAAGLCFGDASNLLVTFSTPGPDRYADGSTVRDGERYALVYVRGTFGGIAADGSAVEADDAVVAVLSRAEKGRCPTTVFQVPSDLAKTLTGGSYAVYLLDTRLAPTDAVRLAATDAKTGLPTAIAATTEVATKPLSAAGGLWLRSRYAILSRKLSFCAQDEKAN